MRKKKPIKPRELNNLIAELGEAVGPPRERQSFYREFGEALLEVPLEAVTEGALTREELVYVLVCCLRLVRATKEVAG